MPATLKFSQFLAEAALETAVGLTPGASVTGFLNAKSPGSGGGGGSSGVVQIIMQPNTFAATDVGKAVMVNSSGVYVFAVADNAADGEEVGLLVAAGNPAQFSVQQIGYVTLAATSLLLPLTPGMVYWLSDVGGASAGELSTTEPTAVGHISKPMLIADSTTTGWVLDMRGYVIAAGVPIGGGGSGGGTSSGLINTITQSNAFVGGECVRLNSSGLFVTAQADSEADSDVVGFVVNAISSSSFVLQTAGYNSAPPQLGGISSYTPGQAYWLSPTAAGMMTATEPSSAGQWSKPVFIALSATTGFILEQRSILVGSTVSFPITTAQGGTGNTSFTPNNVIASGAISTSPLVGIPPATAGYVLTSNGPSVEPTFQPTSGTVTIPVAVSQGGTGDTSLTAYGPLVGGTTSTSPVQVVTPSASAGLPLLSGGAAALPSYAALGIFGGGTGTSGYTPYNVIAAGATSISPLVGIAPSTAGFVLTSNGPSAEATFQPSSFSGTLGVANGGTGDSSLTPYSVLAGGATSTSPIVGIVPGTSGYVLTSTGPTSEPTFQSPGGGGGGGLTWIASQNAVGLSVVSFTGMLSSTYDNYLIILEGLGLVTNTGILRLQIGVSGTYFTSGYIGSVNGTKFTSGAGTPITTVSGTTAIDLMPNSTGSLMVADTVTSGLCGNILLAGVNIPLAGFYRLGVSSTISYPILPTLGSNVWGGCQASGQLQSGTPPYTDVQILAYSPSGSVTFDGGIIKLYGYQN